MLLSLLLWTASCYWNDEEGLLQDLADNVDRLLELNTREFEERAFDLKNDLESNARISRDKIREFIKFMEERKEKKRIKKIVEKLLKKRGLDKITGKKFAAVQKGCKLAKTKCLRAQKMARAVARRR